jgi:hypothetical protein
VRQHQQFAAILAGWRAPPSVSEVLSWCLAQAMRVQEVRVAGTEQEPYQGTKQVSYSQNVRTSVSELPDSLF